MNTPTCQATRHPVSIRISSIEWELDWVSFTALLADCPLVNLVDTFFLTDEENKAREKAALGNASTDDVSDDDFDYSPSEITAFFSNGTEIAGSAYDFYIGISHYADEDEALMEQLLAWLCEHTPYDWFYAKKDRYGLTCEPPIYRPTVTFPEPVYAHVSNCRLLPTSLGAFGLLTEAQLQQLRDNTRMLKDR